MPLWTNYSVLSFIDLIKKQINVDKNYIKTSKYQWKINNFMKK